MTQAIIAHSSHKNRKGKLPDLLFPRKAKGGRGQTMSYPKAIEMSAWKRIARQSELEWRTDRFGNEF